GRPPEQVAVERDRGVDVVGGQLDPAGFARRAHACSFGVQSVERCAATTGAVTFALIMWVCRGRVSRRPSARASTIAAWLFCRYAGLLPPAITSTGCVTAAYAPSGRGEPCCRSRTIA